MVFNVTLTAHSNLPHPKSLVGAARWISVTKGCCARDALETVRRIYGGEPLTMSEVFKGDLSKWSDCPWFDVTVEKPERRSTWDNVAREQTSQRELLDLACSGDADAAIKFCLLYNSGQVSLHAAFG